MAEEQNMDMFMVMLEAVKAMPEGPEKNQMIERLYKDYDGMQAIIDEELANATTDYNTDMPEGREAGGIYVAANPMEHMASALRQGFGAYQRKGALDKMNELSKDRSEGLTALMRSQYGGTDPADIDSQGVPRAGRSPEDTFQSVSNPAMHVSQALRNPAPAQQAAPAQSQVPSAPAPPKSPPMPQQQAQPVPQPAMPSVHAPRPGQQPQMSMGAFPPSGQPMADALRQRQGATPVAGGQGVLSQTIADKLKEEELLRQKGIVL